MTRLFAGTQWDRPPRCERCGDEEAACKCPPLPIEYPDPSTLTLKICVEKRRNGKTATVIRGLLPQQADISELLSSLKQMCGAGGTTKEDSIEIQGDHLVKVEKFLGDRRFRVKIGR